MENKREKIARKIRKLFLSHFSLNIIIAIFAMIYFLSVSVCLISIDNSNNEKELENQAIINNINQTKINQNFANLTPNSGSKTDSGKLEDPIFKNAIDSNIYAFNNFYNYNSYELELHGSSNASLMDVEICINTRICKYESGTILGQVVRKETKTNFGQTSATQTVFKNGMYKRSGSNIRLENGYYVADFSGGFTKTSTRLSTYPMYLVTKATCLYSKSFTFERDKNGQITYYRTTLILDPNGATDQYRIQLAEEGGISNVSLSSLEISSVIDRDGNLVSFSVTEEFSGKMSLISFSTVNRLNYTLVSFNKKPSIEEPQI